MAVDNVNHQLNRRRRERERKAKKKKKKKAASQGCCSCCSCCSSDKVADRDSPLATESEPIQVLQVDSDSKPEASAESETDAELELVESAPPTGCCACCRSRKRKPRRRRPEEKRKPGKCVTCCKRFVTFLVSQIGLSALVVAYSVLGGFIFMKLEAPHEVVERHAVATFRRAKVEILWNITKELNIFYEQNWTMLAEEVFMEFQKYVFEATKERGWDGRDGTSELQWSFAGALLYSVTVITTIGYGHIAPKTMYGRLVTMFYALVGIPLTLLCLANLGSFMGNCFRCLYKHICLGLLYLCCPPQARRRAKDAKKPKVKGKYVKRTQGAGKTAKAATPAAVAAAAAIEAAATATTTTTATSSEGETGEVTVTIEFEQPEEEEEEVRAKEEPVRVPMFVSLLIIALYIFGGAVLFSVWEEDWDYLIASYFCFITLSTVGFGDFVPGANSGSFADQNKLIICAFYLVFGLALIAMCFNLMQEEVRAKFRWLGKKLRIIDDKRR